MFFLPKDREKLEKVFTETLDMAEKYHAISQSNSMIERGLGQLLTEFRLMRETLMQLDLKTDAMETAILFPSIKEEVKPQKKQGRKK